MRQITIALLIALACGCSSTVVGVPEGAEYIYVKGVLKINLASSLPAVEEATRTAFQELDVVGVQGGADRLKGKMTARLADGTKVTLTMKAIDFDSTVLQIKVGTFGDRAISTQILRYIRQNL